jgi:hypothetical protein
MSPLYSLPSASLRLGLALALACLASAESAGAAVFEDFDDQDDTPFIQGGLTSGTWTYPADPLSGGFLYRITGLATAGLPSTILNSALFAFAPSQRYRLVLARSGVALDLHDAVVRDEATGAAVVTLSATDSAHSVPLITELSVNGAAVFTAAAASFDDFFVSNGSDDSDGDEVNTHGTNPLVVDTDGAGTDPLDDQDFPPLPVPSMGPFWLVLISGLLAATALRRLRR